MSNLNGEKMHEIMEWAYDKAVTGMGLGSATDMANDYLNQSGTLEEKINSLIRWQSTKAGSAGFATGVGGLITLPVALPANIASTLYIQIRMIVAIAHMTGCDVHNDKVKTLIYLCLLGNSVNEVLKDTGIAIGTKFTHNFIMKNITSEMLQSINKAVGFKLITKAGEKGVINLTKVVPLVGGVISGGMDALTTTLIGNKARDIFLSFEYHKITQDDFKGNIYEHQP